MDFNFFGCFGDILRNSKNMNLHRELIGNYSHARTLAWRSLPGLSASIFYNNIIQMFYSSGY